ncbi:MAG: ATP-binding protein [Solirubrobacteraceae bacterium]|nr:ATP-binding protein [Solirubrobacteraceae bacterium]
MSGDAPIDFLPVGTPIDLDNCDREPIHIPGAVQPHGVLLVARTSDGEIVQTSANTQAVLGHAPDAILGQTLSALAGAGTAERLGASAQRTSGPVIRPDRLELFTGTIFDAQTFTPAEGLLGVELEPADPDEPDALTAITRVGAWSASLQACDSIESMAAAAATALRELTGYDRVWTYRFEADGHGVVIAEDADPSLESFLGLHFPESDIPRQARELYVRNRVRVIPDVAAVVAPLVPVLNPETDTSLDLSGGSLRAVSPMHIRYLTNMGVRASLSVSIVVGGRLWGLLSAHHYGGPKYVPVRVRSECEVLGSVTSMCVSTATQLEQAQQGLGLQQSANAVLEALTGIESIAEGLTAVPDGLLGLCRATGAIVSIGGERRTVGDVPADADIDRLIGALTDQPHDLIVTDRLGILDPTLDDLATVASGLVAFSLSRRQGNWVIWLRRETIEEVTWANRDKELVRREPSGELRLGERESFERWAGEVRGRSRPWGAAELDAVRDLRTAVAALVITRAEKLARLNDELARSNTELDAFAYAAAHDLREPVRGIEQFAGFLLEDHGDAVGDDGREQIETIRRLTGRMGGLLDALLDYAQLGEQVDRRTTVDLPTVVGEVRELLAARLDADVEISVEPATLHADEDGLRQLLFNLVWNGVKYSEADAEIEVGTCWLSDAPDSEAHVRRSAVGDAEPVAIYVRDRGIGIDPDHFDVIFELFRRLHGKDDYGGGAGAGLTLSRRIVERHGGAIWVDSALGEGTTFYFTLEAA